MASFDDVDFDDPVDLGRAQFGTQRKGYDQDEVRRFLQLVARHASDRRDALRALESRVAELEESLAQAQSEVVRELSEEELRELLGAEAAKVLQAAHDSYDIQMAEVEAEREASQRKLTAEREAVKQRSAADYTAEIESAKAMGRELVVEAQVVRERVLRDLSRRRQAGRRELEQVRAGRDRLLASFATAQDSLDAILEDIEVSLPQARIAAEAAGRRFDQDLEQEQSGDAIADESADVAAIEQEIAVARDLDLPMVAAVDTATDPEPITGVDATSAISPAADLDRTDPSEQDGQSAHGGADVVEAGASDDDPDVRTVVLRDLGPVRRGLFSKRPRDADDLPTMEVPVLRAPESFEGVTVVDAPPNAAVDAAIESPVAPMIEPEVDVDAESATGAEASVDDHSAADELPLDQALDDDVDALFAKLRAKPASGEDEDAAESDVAEQTSPRAAAKSAAPDAEPSSAAEVSGSTLAAVATAAGADLRVVEPAADPESDPPAAKSGKNGKVGKKASRKARAGKKESRKSGKENKKASTEPDVAPDSEPTEASAPAPPTDAQLLANRDRLSQGLEEQLARQLKRTLADDQNELFDLVRRSKTAPSFDDVPALDEHARWYFTAVEGMLDRIARAGHEWVSGASGPAGQSDLSAAQKAIVDTLIVPLRDIVEAAFANDELDDPLAEIRFKARGVRDKIVPIAAADATYLAFSAGTVAAIPADANVRWLRDANVCGDDCQARAEQAPQTFGQTFDGVASPPASPECRCLLAPVIQ